MREFFHGWRRKAGCVALVLECVLTTGWISDLGWYGQRDPFIMNLRVFVVRASHGVNVLVQRVLLAGGTNFEGLKAVQESLGNGT